MANCHYKQLKTKQAQTGFTLLEVMVAVAILALALTSLVRIVGQSTNTLSYLEKKTYAQWVAVNQVNELEITSAWPAVGQTQGQEDMGGLPWHWQVTASDTGSTGLRRLDVSVKQHLQDENALYKLTAFIHKP